jgi:5,10-methylenetetrahydromethanopterin reductase
MDLSCAFPPSLNIVEQVVLAERLGYRRAWVYDSPAFYGDAWVALARAAERTTRIGLGTAVLVPSLRHVLTQAAAIATLAELAPGRLAVAVGTGFTARMALGQRPLPWSSVARYIRQLQALLRGEVVDVDGAAVSMLHPGGFAPTRPLAVPILVAANAPKGLQVARDLGDGVMCVGQPQPGFAWCALLAFGTVLDAGEDAGSARALAAAGPALAAAYHGIYEAGGAAAIDGMPGGPQWRAALEAVPARTRHLALHELHLVGVNDRDRSILSGEMVRALTWTGSAAEIGGRLAAAAAAGTTEILYAPMGPDVARELTAFAAAAGR